MTDTPRACTILLLAAAIVAYTYLAEIGSIWKQCVHMIMILPLKSSLLQITA